MKQKIVTNFSNMVLNKDRLDINESVDRLIQDMANLNVTVNPRDILPVFYREGNTIGLMGLEVSPTSGAIRSIIYQANNGAIEIRPKIDPPRSTTCDDNSKHTIQIPAKVGREISKCVRDFADRTSSWIDDHQKNYVITHLPQAKMWEALDVVCWFPDTIIDGDDIRTFGDWDHFLGDFLQQINYYCMRETSHAVINTRGGWHFLNGKNIGRAREDYEPLPSKSDHYYRFAETVSVIKELKRIGFNIEIYNMDHFPKDQYDKYKNSNLGIHLKLSFKKVNWKP